MELRFDLWHLAFVSLIERRAPPNFEVQSEVRLTIEPQRADMLLLRRVGVEWKDDQGLVLRALWPRLGRVAIVEYKSPVDSAFRPGDLVRLVTYGGLYETAHLDELPEPGDLTLVLVVASVTPTLSKDLARKGWTLTPLGDGYARVDGVMYDMYVVITDEVTEAERDDYLRLFSHRPASPGEATRWLRQWMRDAKMKQPDIEELPSFEELFQKTIEKAQEKWLAGLAPEERLAGLAPEERLAGLAPEERLAGLAPGERLAGLAPEERLAGLAPEERLAGLAPEERLAGLAPEERLAGLAPEERLAGLAPEERLAGLAPEERLAGLAPEERLAGLAPEERLAGLATEQVILALPVEVLRMLSDEHIRSLPPNVQETIRKRLQSAAH